VLFDSFFSAFTDWVALVRSLSQTRGRNQCPWMSSIPFVDVDIPSWPPAEDRVSPASIRRVVQPVEHSWSGRGDLNARPPAPKASRRSFPSKREPALDSMRSRAIVYSFETHL
jgi:hypothetical protein